MYQLARLTYVKWFLLPVLILMPGEDMRPHHARSIYGIVKLLMRQGIVSFISNCRTCKKEELIEISKNKDLAN